MPTPGVVLGLGRVNIVLHSATRSTKRYPRTVWFDGLGPYNWKRAMDTTDTGAYHVLIYSPWRGFREFDFLGAQDMMSTLANWLGLVSYVWGLSGSMLIWRRMLLQHSRNLDPQCVYAHESIIYWYIYIYYMSNFSIFNMFLILII